MQARKKRYTFNAASYDAYQQSQQQDPSDRVKIYAYICDHAEGVTSKEISAKLLNNRPLHVFSGRIRELEQAGMIERLKIRRDGCELLVKAEDQWRLL